MPTPTAEQLQYIAVRELIAELSAPKLSPPLRGTATEIMMRMRGQEEALMSRWGIEPEKAQPSVTVEQAHYEELKRLAFISKSEIDQRVREALKGGPLYRDDPTYVRRDTKPKTKYEPAPMPSDDEIDAVLAQIRRSK